MISLVEVLSRVGLVIFCLLFGIYSLEAQLEIKGVISSDDKETIGFATVHIKDSECGTVSDEHGFFQLACQVDDLENQYLIIRSLGYKSITVPVDAFENNDTLFLPRVGYKLATVEVGIDRDKKLEKTKLGYPFKRPYFYYQKNIESTYEIAARITNHQSGYPSSLKFKIGNVASDKSTMRIHFYEIDELCSCPARTLHSENIIVDIKSGWNKIDLRDFMIQIPNEDFFLGFEWLPPIISKASKKLDFSLGMIPVKNGFPLLEKIGDLAWRPINQKGNTRPLTSIVLKVD